MVRVDAVDARRVGDREARISANLWQLDGANFPRERISHRRQDRADFNVLRNL